MAMDKILICLSENKHSLSILKYAKDFARKFNLVYEVILIKRMKFLDGEMFFGEMPTIVQSSEIYEMEESISKTIYNEVKALIDPEISISTLEDSADLIDKLERKYENREFSLLILPHSHELIYWPFMDSLNKFINAINCPILLVDPTAAFKDIEHAVYASNYLASDTNVLKRFIKISNNRVKHIDIIHISFADNFRDKIMEKGFEAYIKEHITDTEIAVHSTSSYRSQDSLVELFLKEVEKLAPDILIIMKEEKSGIEELFSKSFTISTAKKTVIPMLILHERYSKINTNE